MKLFYKKCAVFLSTIIFLSGCAITTGEPLSKTGVYFDTVITITLYDTKDEELLSECFSYCEQFEKMVSRTLPDSEISRINAANGTPVEVSDTTIELLKHGIFYGELTNGAFDITIAPLSELWDFKNNIGTVPSEAEIQDVLSHVNYKNIKIDGNKVSLSDPEAAIDLGGIAKGYIADHLKEYLISEGVGSALINLGGNVQTIGKKPDGSAYHIGIQKPFDKQGTAITSVEVSNSSVVSSGVYERYFEIDDTLYHHILNTKTGYPCDNNLLGVTILSQNSVDGDALSTSCFALGLEEGIELIHSLDDVDAIFVTETYELVDTRNQK